MFFRLTFLLIALAIGMVIGPAVPGASRLTRLAGLEVWSPASSQKAEGHGHNHGPGHKHETEGVVKISAGQIAASRIELAKVGGGVLARRISAPGTVVADADRVVRVPAKVAGAVAEMRKRLGDTVAAGDVLAVLESREVADAKSDYLAASLTNNLQQTIFAREKMLWEGKVLPENSFLRARVTAEEARIKLEVARQRLAALGLGESEIAAIAKEPVASLRRRELRAPIAGRVVERKAGLGTPVQPDTEVFQIADLSRVWVEMAVSPSDLSRVKVGQRVAIANGLTGEEGEAVIIFISPLLDNETRSARIVAEADNETQKWRPGIFITAAIVAEEQKVDLLVPTAALQTIGGEQVVFVRTAEGFEKRDVVVGRRDDRSAEIVFGLDADETIAVANTFVLKAELSKAEAEHSHAH